MEARRDVFQAIADPTRRSIIDLLAKQSLNLNAVAEQFDISRPAISKHIRILTECGLITIRQEGRERYCEAQLQQLKQVANWTQQYSSFWDNKLNNLQAFLAKEKSTKKK
jgi:DNA-binding transcriptional ArsR family regulator